MFRRIRCRCSIRRELERQHAQNHVRAGCRRESQAQVVIVNVDAMLIDPFLRPAFPECVEHGPRHFRRVILRVSAEAVDDRRERPAPR